MKTSKRKGQKGKQIKQRESNCCKKGTEVGALLESFNPPIMYTLNLVPVSTVVWLTPFP